MLFLDCISFETYVNLKPYTDLMSEFASEPSVRSHSGRSHSRNKRVGKSSDQPISLDDVVDLSNTKDKEVTTRTLPGEIMQYRKLYHHTLTLFPSTSCRA
jgi:hypothetical protein